MDSGGQYPSFALRDAIRARIAAAHGAALPRLIAVAAEKYLRAYRNQSNWNVNYNGEAFVLRSIAAAIDGDVLDVGANEGQWASKALTIIGGKQLHSFEVAPDTFLRLQQRIGDQPNVQANNFGLGAETKSIEINYYPDRPDRTSAFYMDDAFEKRKVTASIMKGDEYIRDHSIDQVAFLKIDVEGMEMDVLSGLETSFGEGVIKAVQFEHGPSHVLSRSFLKDFVDFFARFGFDLFRCYPNALRELRYDVQWDEDFTGENFVALHADVPDGVRQLVKS